MKKIKYLFAAGVSLLLAIGVKTAYADTTEGCQALTNTTWTTSLRLNSTFDPSQPVINNVVTLKINSVVKGDHSYGLQGTMSSTGSDSFSAIPFYGSSCDQSADGKITWVSAYIMLNDSIYRILSRNLSGSVFPVSLNIPKSGVNWQHNGINYLNKDEASLEKA